VNVVSSPYSNKQISSKNPQSSAGTPPMQNPAHRQQPDVASTQIPSKQTCPPGQLETHVPLEQHCPDGQGFDSEQGQTLTAVVGAGAQALSPQAFPDGQHSKPRLLRQLVVPEGQPQIPLLALRHATPALQHDVPHGVVPDGQQQPEAASEHVPLQHLSPQWACPLGHAHVPVERFWQAMPALQQHGPHGVVPALHGALVGPLHVAASARNGLSTVAAAAAAAAPPRIFSTPRRECEPAIAREISSNRSLMCPPRLWSVNPTSVR
jgi:hypothetical protein